MTRMFSGSLSILTSLAMLAHSVLGCCWHHAHHSDCRHDQHTVLCDDAPAEHHEHACAHGHAQDSTGDGHRHAVSGDAMLSACCGEQHGQHAPLECCAEAECTYLPTASPVLTGPVGMSADVPASAVIALSAGGFQQCHGGVEGGLPSTSTARRCALVQVWRL